MPGILAQQSKEGLVEGKGGPVPKEEEEEEEVKQIEISVDDLKDGGGNQKLKTALEELSLDKNGEAVMEEDGQLPRLSSPDSGIACV